jgi:hypothetical protein
MASKPASLRNGAGTPAIVATFDVLYDTLRQHGHRPALHIIADHRRTVERTWLTAAGVGALGDDAEHAARVYLVAGAALTDDEPLRAELRRLAA